MTPGCCLTDVARQAHRTSKQHAGRESPRRDISGDQSECLQSEGQYEATVGMPSGRVLRPSGLGISTRRIGSTR
jgi:hypothetical protein